MGRSLGVFVCAAVYCCVWLCIAVYGCACLGGMTTHARNEWTPVVMDVRLVAAEHPSLALQHNTIQYNTHTIQYNTQYNSI